MNLAASQARYHIVISDLHFGDGQALEDFIYEDDFCALLDHAAGQGHARGGTAEVIINGDFIDFLQVAPLRAGPWREALAKLKRVANAHSRAMDAMARFVRAGNSLVILPGNHDIELHFREVQGALIHLLADGDAEATERIVFPNDAPLGPHFRGWQRGPFAYRLPGTYIEHGNQFDAMNFFDHSDFFGDEKERSVRPPWGSQFVLDVFNGVESRYKFIDKLRPRSAALLILWLLDSELVKDRLPMLLGLARGGLPAALLRYHSKFESVKQAGIGARGSDGIILPHEAGLAWLGQYADDLRLIDMEREALHEATGEQSPGHRGGRRWSRLLSGAVARVCQAALDALTARSDRIEEGDGYQEAAFNLALAERVDLVVLGHTHGLRDLRRDGRRYLNSGTWIGLLDWDPAQLRNATPQDYAAFLQHLRSERSLAPAKLLSFVEISYPSGKLSAELRLFRDGASVPVPRSEKL